MPIMFHCLDVMRVNSYIIVKKIGDKKISHKKYVQELIQVLLARATGDEIAMTRHSTVTMKAPPKQQGKRKHVSSKNPALPAYRLHGKKEEHQHVPASSQLYC